MGALRATFRTSGGGSDPGYCLHGDGDDVAFSGIDRTPLDAPGGCRIALDVRFYLDPRTGLAHIHSHGVTEPEVEFVLARPGEDRAGRDGSRIAIGRTSGGRYLRVVYVRDGETERLFVITAMELTGKPLHAYRRRRRKNRPMKRNQYPTGWSRRRVKRVLDHYELQTEEQAVAEDEAAFGVEGQTVMTVPSELVPVVRDLIDTHKRDREKRDRRASRK